jgi:hypothetical protein
MMDLNIRELSESFSELLPLDKEKYTLSDIESSGIPFLVRKQISQITHRHFKQSVQYPESEWGGLQSAKALELWDSYLQQMEEVLEIPAEKAQDVIFEATEFALKLAVQPRKTVVKLLFEGEDVVTKETLHLRLDQILSNRHLAFALMRYMEKKQKESLGVDEAKQIIKKVDEKLTEPYNSLDWMEAVKPIFNVAGPDVASDLIRVFFEEKELYRVARKFDMMETDLTETDFVEVMSSADLLDLSGFEEEQPVLFSDEDESTEENEAAEPPETKELSVTEEKTESSLSDNFVSSDDNDEIEEADPDAEMDDAPEEADQQKLNLLELFREDDEIDVDELEEEPRQEEEAEDDREDEPVKKFKPLTDEEPGETESEFSDDTEDEDSIASEKEMGITRPEDVAQTDEYEFGDDEEVPGEENDDVEDAELPNEDQLIFGEDGTDEAEEIEEESLLARFMEDDQNEDAEEPVVQDTDEEEHEEPNSIYEELNLAQFEEDAEPEDKLNIEEDDEKEDLTAEDEPDDFQEEEDIPFEPNDRFGESFSDDEDTEMPFTVDDQYDEVEADTDEEESDDEEGNDDVPMWKSFLERDNPDDEPSFYFDEGTEDSSDEVPPQFDDEIKINDAPAINISGESSKFDDGIEHLSKWLAADRDRFLHDIFEDSKLAWEQALIDLTVFDDWKSASRYLEKEIFNKNRIDIYSEVAVDFTDSLHSYFMEYKS